VVAGESQQDGDRTCNKCRRSEVEPGPTSQGETHATVKREEAPR
jgi:hypothetical protein